MTIDQLETLEKIIEKGSFKAAAESLHKTQPSLSVAIKKLEEEFNVRLFSREEYRPKLTEEGKTFYRWTQNCLRTFRELEVVGRELGKQAIEPRLQIVLDPLVRFESLREAFAPKADLPNVTDFSFRSETLGTGMQLLINEECDFAVASMEVEDERIEGVPFAKVKMIPVASTKLLGDQKVDYEWLRTHRQVVVSKDLGKSEVLLDSKGMLSRGPKCFVSDHTMKRNLILAGLGWGRLSIDDMGAELRKGAVVELKHKSIPSFVLDLYVMRSKVRALGPVARVIWAHLVKQAESNFVKNHSRKKGK